MCYTKKFDFDFSLKGTWQHGFYFFFVFLYFHAYVLEITEVLQTKLVVHNL